MTGQAISAAGADPDSFLSFFFSFQGRVSRKDYWLRGVLLYFLLVFVAMMIAVSIGNTLFTTLVFLLSFWPGLAVGVKRWHDRSKSGWFVLVNLIPIVGGVWSFVELGCLRGTEGDNAYGHDPLAA